MRCPDCGRECVEESNFCFYCGHSFRDKAEAEDVKESREENVPAEGGLKTWQWMLYFLLLIIPYTWIIWMIITCVWAFGNNGSAERKKMAKGMLLAVLILVVLAVIAVMYYVSKYGMDGLIEYVTNGAYKTFDEYMNALQ